MNCAWNELLNILPLRIRSEVDRLGRQSLQELRLRVNQSPELVTFRGSVLLDTKTTGSDLGFVINTASRYSPWSAATAACGYITAAGGHRIGLCGETVCSDTGMSGIRQPSSLCIRVARDFHGIADDASAIQGNILILGPPGSGKTTLLRDLIRQKSDVGPGSVAVVDERREIFPVSEQGICFGTGCRTDVISGCPKSQGIDTVLRSMGPAWIAVDEITAAEDCDALIRSGWCGVSLIATAHAASVYDLLARPVYKPLVQSNLFETALVLKMDKSWRKERIPCGA